MGNNGLSTLFSGLIQDDMFAAAQEGQPDGGRVTKVGAGTLTLTHANTYSGGTIVKSGVLRVRNETGSAIAAPR